MGKDMNRIKVGFVREIFGDLLQPVLQCVQFHHLRGDILKLHLIQKVLPVGNGGIHEYHFMALARQRVFRGGGRWNQAWLQIFHLYPLAGRRFLFATYPMCLVLTGKHFLERVTEKLLKKF